MYIILNVVWNMPQEGLNNYNEHNMVVTIEETKGFQFSLINQLHQEL